MQKSPKSYLITLLLSFFLGTLGFHRFYVGKIGTGVLMLLTCGGLFIWYVVDFIIVMLSQFTDKEGKIIKP